MVTGDVLYQFILDCHFTNRNLASVILTCVIYIPQVSYMHYTHQLMCVLYNTGSVHVNAEAVGALNNAHQLNNCFVDNYILDNDGASDDRAVKCCISNHCHHNSRRRLVAVKATATNDQCMHIHK